MTDQELRELLRRMSPRLDMLDCENVLTAVDRIAELAEERDTARRLLGAATQMQAETQAKLAKTMEALRGILKGDDMYPWRIAREILVELEGEVDEQHC